MKYTPVVLLNQDKKNCFAWLKCTLHKNNFSSVHQFQCLAVPTFVANAKPSATKQHWLTRAAYALLRIHDFHKIPPFLSNHHVLYLPQNFTAALQCWIKHMWVQILQMKEQSSSKCLNSWSSVMFYSLLLCSVQIYSCVSVLSVSRSCNGILALN